MERATRSSNSNRLRDVLLQERISVEVARHFECVMRDYGQIMGDKPTSGVNKHTWEEPASTKENKQ